MVLQAPAWDPVSSWHWLFACVMPGPSVGEGPVVLGDAWTAKHLLLQTTLAARTKTPTRYLIVDGPLLR